MKCSTVRQAACRASRSFGSAASAQAHLSVTIGKRHQPWQNVTAFFRRHVDAHSFEQPQRCEVQRVQRLSQRRDAAEGTVYGLIQRIRIKDTKSFTAKLICGTAVTAACLSNTFNTTHEDDSRPCCLSPVLQNFPRRRHGQRHCGDFP